MRWFLKCLILPIFAFGLDYNFEVENTNIFTTKEGLKSNDYNRLRFYNTLESKDYENFLFTLIFDNYNNFDFDSNNNSNTTKIYRAYLSYMDEKNIITIGKQRIPFGVGRVWNPTDIFNPIDATAIETDEREGIESIRYEYAINNLSTTDLTISKDKYAFRIKGYLEFADLALLALKDTKENKEIFGYEAQGEFLDTGIELRSEGAYFKNKNSKDYEEFIFGAEYGFENSFNILTEYKYNSLDNQDYLALNLSYTISTLWNCNYLLINNIDDKSSVSITRFIYSLSDDSELDFGTYIYTGNKSSEYGRFDDALFVRYFIHF